MYPLKGLTTTPVVGVLEVPQKDNDLAESFFGGTTLGSTTTPVKFTGTRNTLWSCRYLDGNVELTNGTMTMVLFNEPNITELSACLDAYMLPVVTYMRLGVAYLRYFNVTTKQYVTVNLDTLAGNIRTPRLCFDDRRKQFRYSASVILGYILDKKLIIRTMDDKFNSALIIRDFADNKNYLNQISMGDNNRLHFVPYRIQE